MSSELDRLTSVARQWDVAIEQMRETTTYLLAFGLCRDTRVVLKISKQTGDEWHGGDVLRAFNGDGTVRVYRYEPGAVLLEWLEPGNELVELVRRGEDERATEILARVMQQMRGHQPSHVCPSPRDWARGFDRYLKMSDEQIDRRLVQRAATLYQSLTDSQQDTMLLHGDLHHYNVLFDSRRGWLAIDPKGVVAELEYEVGAILRNPVEQSDLFLSVDVLERRLEILTTFLRLDYRRALQWSFAQSVLSAIWNVEDGILVRADNPALRLAGTIEPLLAKI